MTRTPERPGEYEAAVNTIAQGRPAVPAVPVVTPAPVFHFSAGVTAGAAEHPAFPAPSAFARVEETKHHSDKICRENEFLRPIESTFPFVPAGPRAR